MSNGQGDLIQTTLDAWGTTIALAAPLPASGVGNVRTSAASARSSGPSAAFDFDDQITIVYQLGSDNNTWTQTMTSKKLGKVVSTLSHADGLLDKTGFGFATEADANSFTIDNQYYINTEFHFAAADPHFGSTGVGGIGANNGNNGTGSGIGTAQNVRTPDGGLTWLVDLITLPPMNPQGPQTPPPSIGGCTTTTSRPMCRIPLVEPGSRPPQRLLVLAPP